MLYVYIDTPHRCTVSINILWMLYYIHVSYKYLSNIYQHAISMLIFMDDHTTCYIH